MKRNPRCLRRGFFYGSFAACKRAIRDFGLADDQRGRHLVGAAFIVMEDSSNSHGQGGALGDARSHSWYRSSHRQEAPVSAGAFFVASIPLEHCRRTPCLS